VVTFTQEFADLLQAQKDAAAQTSGWFVNN